MGLKGSEVSDWLIVFDPVLLARVKDRPKCQPFGPCRTGPTLLLVVVASAREVKSQLFPDFFFWKILLLTILFFQGKIYLLLFPHRLMEKYACYYTDCTTVRTLNHLVGNQPRLSWKKEIYFQIVIIILLQQERYY